MSERAPWAAGMVVFVAFLMCLAGSFHAIVGLAAILSDEIVTPAPNFVFEFDPTAWGVIHLVVSGVLFLAAFAIVNGTAWALAVGVVFAAVSALGAFASLPLHPFWSAAIIAVDVAAIWALTVHGRELAAD
jgi:hypothetical protein